jgi:hypothetical protein
MGNACVFLCPAADEQAASVPEGAAPLRSPAAEKRKNAVYSHAQGENGRKGRGRNKTRRQLSAH